MQVQEKHLQVSTGNVVSCSGLGEHAVSSATRLLEPTDTVHGALGGLTSFVAMSTQAHVRSVKAVSILLDFALPPARIQDNATYMHMGMLDFTDNFRTAGIQTQLCHFLHAYEGAAVFQKNYSMRTSIQYSVTVVRGIGVIHRGQKPATQLRRTLHAHG